MHGRVGYVYGSTRRWGMKYRFYMEVTDPRTGETVRCEWDGLTLLGAKQMYKATATKYAVNNYVAQVERFGWEEMK
jgi:hypothetical protein